MDNKKSDDMKLKDELDARGGIPFRIWTAYGGPGKPLSIIRIFEAERRSYRVVYDLVRREDRPDEYLLEKVERR